MAPPLEGTHTFFVLPDCCNVLPNMMDGLERQIYTKSLFENSKYNIPTFIKRKLLRIFQIICDEIANISCQSNNTNDCLTLCVTEINYIIIIIQTKYFNEM